MPRLRAIVLASAALAAAPASVLAQTATRDTAPAAEAPAVRVDEQPVLLEADSVRVRVLRLYPASLRMSRAAGTTHVAFTVRPDGTTADARVARPSPHPALDSAALAVVAGMRFTPARLRGTAVAAPVTLPIEFAAPAAVAAVPEGVDWIGRGVAQGRAETEGERRPERPGEAVVAPRLVNRGPVARALRSAYPPALRAQGVGGEAVVRLLVNPEGRPTSVEIVRSSGHPDLDRVIATVAEQARFTPPRKGRRRVAAWALLPIRMVPPPPEPVTTPPPPA
jgi:protein TonB